jgi:hypothetical protein
LRIIGGSKPKILVYPGIWRIFLCDEGCFAELEWLHDDYDDAYHNRWDDEDEDYYSWLYYHDKEERLEEFFDDENIYSIDYNAVIIYPNYMNLWWKGEDEFLNRRSKVKKGKQFRRERGYVIKTDEEECWVVNSIVNPHRFVVSPNDYPSTFSFYDIRTLLIPLINNGDEWVDIIPIIYKFYVSLMYHC